MTAIVDCANITATPIELTAYQYADDASGALITFEGRVRNHDAGQNVVAIEYVAHPDSARILRDICASFTDRSGVQRLCAIHRIGKLEIGELALLARVCAAHRQEGFATLSALIEDIKARLPMWKKQYFKDGHTEWVGIHLQDAQPPAKGGNTSS